MVKLFCTIIGVAGTPSGSAFPIVIGEGETVRDLKKAIKDDNSATITGDAKDLQLFLAKTEDGAWLTEADVKNGVEGTDGLTPLDAAGAPLHLVDLSEEDVRFQLTKEAVKAKKTPVHVLVVVPGDAGVSVAPVEPLSIPTAMHRHPERLKRWAAINEMVRQKNQEGNEKTSNPDTNTRKRKNRDLDRSMPYLSLSWADLEPILPMEDFNLEAKPVSGKVVEELRDRLVQVRKLYGDIYSGKEAKR